LTKPRFSVSREQLRWMMARPPLYPQAVTPFYVVFHVKLGSLWITSVDNYHRHPVIRDGDGGRRFRHCLNG
jgi:hypothetical protein